MLGHPGADGGAVRTQRGCKWRDHYGEERGRLEELAITVCLGIFGDTW